MRRCIPVAVGLLAVLSLQAQELDIYGYYEPQFSGMYYRDSLHQFHSSRLRVDFESGMEHVTFKGNTVYNLYFGKTVWNVTDFLPEEITSAIPPDMLPLFNVSFRDTLYLDNIFARISFRRLLLTIGKQQVSLGTGYFSNPTDIFNTKDVLDPTYEQPGHNGIRADILLRNRINLSLLYAPVEDTWRRSGKLAQLKVGMGHFDISMLFNQLYQRMVDYGTFQVSLQRRRLYGLDLVGEISGIGVWGEGAFHQKEDGEESYEIIAGGDYTFENGFYVLGEFHHNSSAKSDASEYDLNDWMEFFTGASKTIARDQIYSFGRFSITDLFSVGGSVIYCVSDGSMAIVPTFDYGLFENVDITLITNIYTGTEGTAYAASLGNGALLRGRVYF